MGALGIWREMAASGPSAHGSFRPKADADRAGQRIMRKTAIRRAVAIMNQPQWISEDWLARFARNLTSGWAASSCSCVR